MVVVPNDQGLAEANLCRLVNSFVGERTRARNDANATALMDGAGHDSNLASAGGLRALSDIRTNDGGGAGRGVRTTIPGQLGPTRLWAVSAKYSSKEGESQTASCFGS